MTREEDIKKAVEVLRKGGVILYPTDTVWGIGCDATNAEAVKRVYDIKQRDDSKALICLVDSDARMQRYFRNIPDVAWQLIDSLKSVSDDSVVGTKDISPTKPTTIILDGAINLAPNLIAEDGSLGIRITQEPFSKELCYRFQKALVSTSANISGEPAALNLPHRTTATSTRASSNKWTTSAGAVVRNISPIRPAASSVCAKTVK